MGSIDKDGKKEKFKALSKFGKKVITCYNWRRYVSAIISGGFGEGKTAMSFWMGCEIVRYYYGIEDNIECLKIVMDKVIFTLDDLIERMNRFREIDWDSLTPRQVLDTKFKIREPFLIWDDVGIHGSKYKHFVDWESVFELNVHYDTIRDLTSCMILTVPEDSELLGLLTQYRSNYFVELETAEDGDRRWDKEIVFLKWKKDKLGRKRKKVDWRMSEPQTIKIPDEIYGEYDRRRTKAKNFLLEQFEKKKQQRELKKEYEELKMKVRMKKMREYLAGKNVDVEI